MPTMNRERVLIAVFLILTTTLIVGQRFDFTWAGGTGYVAPLQATTTDGAQFARGETVRTEADFKKLNLAGLGRVWMDQYTTLIIERLSADEIILRVDTGRVTVEAGTVPVEVRMDVVSARLANGTAIFINYDQWRRATVIPVKAPVDVWHRGETPLATETPVDVLYDMPGVKPYSNNPRIDGASAYYDWMITTR